ncbi:putative proteasome A-type and B-type [Candidatus Vecturithrix granuli]|uniref:Putative proteasome A-type and B-type n=1 Tax=Vecturithrix granuli TaxID=1499967 RepID=A0A081C9V0_VECG1|nr:putative proteasome A-type and B-type [Candidatus Vecturithrix granuli]
MSKEEGNKLIFNSRYQGSSFIELLHTEYQEKLMPFDRADMCKESVEASLPMATTILAICYADGVLIGGDRRAVEGHRIASQRIEKVYKTDQYSAMAVAGVAGLCIDMAKLFRTELEHYEKIEGEQLMFEGKANKLAHMIRHNFPAAMRGLVVVPIFVGYDIHQQRGRIFKYDVIGGMYEEEAYSATGSGGKDARNTIKKLYRRAGDEEFALNLAIEALSDAAEEDAATGGPDLLHGVFPTLKTVTRQGVQDLPDEAIESAYKSFLERKRQSELYVPPQEKE